MSLCLKFGILTVTFLKIGSNTNSTNPGLRVTPAFINLRLEAVNGAVKMLEVLFQYSNLVVKMSQNLGIIFIEFLREIILTIF